MRDTDPVHLRADLDGVARVLDAQHVPKCYTSPRRGDFNGEITVPDRVRLLAEWRTEALRDANDLRDRLCVAADLTAALLSSRPDLRDTLTPVVRALLGHDAPASAAPPHSEAWQAARRAVLGQEAA